MQTFQFSGGSSRPWRSRCVEERGHLECQKNGNIKWEIGFRANNTIVYFDGSSSRTKDMPADGYWMMLLISWYVKFQVSTEDFDYPNRFFAGSCGIPSEGQIATAFESVGRSRHLVGGWPKTDKISQGLKVEETPITFKAAVLTLDSNDCHIMCVCFSFGMSLESLRSSWSVGWWKASRPTGIVRSAALSNCALPTTPRSTSMKLALNERNLPENLNSAWHSRYCFWKIAK